MKILWVYPAEFQNSEEKEDAREKVKDMYVSHLLKRGEVLEDINVEVIDRYISDTENAATIISKCIEQLNNCDAAFFMKGWERDKVCQVLQFTAKQFGIERGTQV